MSKLIKTWVALPSVPPNRGQAAKETKCLWQMKVTGMLARCWLVPLLFTAGCRKIPAAPRDVSKAEPLFPLNLCSLESHIEVDFMGSHIDPVISTQQIKIRHPDLVPRCVAISRVLSVYRLNQNQADSVQSCAWMWLKRLKIKGLWCENSSFVVGNQKRTGC